MQVRNKHIHLTGHIRNFDLVLILYLYNIIHITPDIDLINRMEQVRFNFDYKFTTVQGLNYKLHKTFLYMKSSISLFYNQSEISGWDLLYLTTIVYPTGPKQPYRPLTTTTKSTIAK